ncbi:MAG: 5-formyltetrahydrofolate cyclo-ligase [Akkermansiaceae bacterium]|nr:5-formyltetrahydrofolate cyclo-ligase [Akkermansiaceae bacterium]
MSTNASAKDKLRSAIRSSLAKISAPTLQAASTGISRSITLESGTNCALFSGTSREPQLLSLLSNENIQWFLPRVTGLGSMTFHQVTSHCNLTIGKFGILEPLPSAPETTPDNLDTLICPGIAFSPSGIRLGQGGGYYDRYLTKTIKARLIGVAFDLQIQDMLPNDLHDIAMHEIISESRHLRISNPGQRG